MFGQVMGELLGESDRLPPPVPFQVYKALSHIE